ncbi:collagen alpha-1(I) chain-like [Cervus elaphus]|uniref:collagen alpha-1(I) chain-like n=1 Tax=Cervus elaphus TaxID=9860 RepID=UPI001CC32337|nr:collagen alpha-1(I) chain-like [Cervus elaphus]
MRSAGLLLAAVASVVVEVGLSGMWALGQSAGTHHAALLGFGGPVSTAAASEEGPDMSSLGARSPPQPLRTARGVRTAPDRAAAPLGGRAGRAAVETPCVLRASRLQAALRLGTHEHRREGAGPAGSLSNGAWPGYPRRPGREGRERRPLRACPPSRRWAPRAPASSGRRGASGPPRTEEAAAGLVVFALKCGCSRPAGGGGVRSLGEPRPASNFLYLPAPRSPAHKALHFQLLQSPLFKGRCPQAGKHQGDRLPAGQRASASGAGEERERGDKGERPASRCSSQAPRGVSLIRSWLHDLDQDPLARCSQAQIPSRAGSKVRPKRRARVGKRWSGWPASGEGSPGLPQQAYFIFPVGMPLRALKPGYFPGPQQARR